MNCRENRLFFLFLFFLVDITLLCLNTLDDMQTDKTLSGFLNILRTISLYSQELMVLLALPHGQFLHSSEGPPSISNFKEECINLDSSERSPYLPSSRHNVLLVSKP